MTPGLGRNVLVEGVRYLGLTQAGPVVILHGAWILLALATWQPVGLGTSPDLDIASRLLRSYAWLGGTDGHGVGSASNLLLVWGKLSLVVYLFEAVARRLIGPRAPFRLWLVALFSGGIALLAYLVLLLRSSGAADVTGVLLLSGLLAILGAASAAWAVGARRLVEVVIARIRSPFEPVG